MMTPVPVWQLWKRGGNKIDFSSDARSRKIAMKDLYCFILWGLYGSISGHTELSIFSKYIIQIEFWQVPNWTVTYIYSATFIVNKEQCSDFLQKFNIHFNKLQSLPSGQPDRLFPVLFWRLSLQGAKQWLLNPFLFRASSWLDLSW